MQTIVRLFCINAPVSLLTAFTCKPGSIYSSFFFKAGNLAIWLFFFYLQKFSEFCNQIIVIQLHIMYLLPQPLCGCVHEKQQQKKKWKCKQALSSFAWCLSTVHVRAYRFELHELHVICISILKKCDMFSAWVHSGSFCARRTDVEYVRALFGGTSECWCDTTSVCIHAVRGAVNGRAEWIMQNRPTILIFTSSALVSTWLQGRAASTYLRLEETAVRLKHATQSQGSICLSALVRVK